jgi:hypothetical protein
MHAAFWVYRSVGIVNSFISPVNASALWEAFR